MDLPEPLPLGEVFPEVNALRGGTRETSGVSLRRLIAVVVLGGAVGCAPSIGEMSERFRSECAALAAAAGPQGLAVEGLDGWLFFVPELRHVGAGRFWESPPGQDTAGGDAARTAILDFKRQLDHLGVELLLVPVPPKSVIYPDRLSAGLDAALADPVPRLDRPHEEFYESLREAGVDVLDLTPLFLSNRDHDRGPLFCRQDTHWSGVGCVVSAEAIATHVRGRSWYGAVTRQPYDREWYSLAIDGDLRDQRSGAAGKLERLQLRRVQLPGTRLAVEPDPASPVVLLGDSHNLVFHSGEDMHATASGLADQLALELGLPVDLVAIRGSGATAARVNLLRRAQRTPGYWAAKRIVVWTFAAREFTEGDGWRLVPLQP